MTERVERICEAYRRGIPVKAIAERMGVQNPAIYKALRRGGVLPPYKPLDPNGPRRGRPKGSVSRVHVLPPKLRPDDNNLPPRTRRDPCPRCGTRADIGCSHDAQRLALEMSL